MWAASCGPLRPEHGREASERFSSLEASNVATMSRSFVLLKVAYAVEALVSYRPLADYFAAFDKNAAAA